MRLISPLRYPGSKRRLASYISQALELNNINPKLYIEPFVGGASVTLQLIIDEVVEQVILIDRDPLIAHFWEAVFFDTNWLVNQIETIEISIEKWHEYKTFKPKSKRDCALTCLFLNRTSFSGIMRNEVGPLGGKEQKSDYKIDCRFPRQTLIKRINLIAQHRDKIAGIWPCSWVEGTNKIRRMQKGSRLPTGDLFFYLDPPFFEKADALYRFYFQGKDHTELRNFLLKLEDQWILSYDSAPHVETLYGDALKNGTNGAKKHSVEIQYSTGIMTGRKPTEEVIISNLKELPIKTRFWKTSSGVGEK